MTTEVVVDHVDAAIERHPTHHFRVDEVSGIAAQFPAPRIGFGPVLADILDDIGDGGPTLACEVSVGLR